MIALPCADRSLDNRHELDAFIRIKNFWRQCESHGVSRMLCKTGISSWTCPIHKLIGVLRSGVLLWIAGVTRSNENEWKSCCT